MIPLALCSWTRETPSPNPYLYNAASEKNERTEWYETAFRVYEAYIGRFQQVDPMADIFGALNWDYNIKLTGNSGYHTKIDSLINGTV